MKISFVTVFALFLSLSAFATVSELKVKCSGTFSKKFEGDIMRLMKISVKTNLKADALEVVMHPAQQRPTRLLVQSFPIRSSAAMFPVSSIQAERDLRPVDGSFEQLSLTISNERVLPGGTSHPSTLTVDSTSYDRRSGREVRTTTKYKLGCEMTANR